MAIAGCNRSEAMKTLTEILGHDSCEVGGRIKASTCGHHPTAKPIDLELKTLEERMTVIDTLMDQYTWRIRHVRELAKRGRMPLVQFYTETHNCEYALAGLDGRYAQAKYNLNQYRKRK